MSRFVSSLIALALLSSLTRTTARAEEAPQVIVPAPAPTPESPAPPTVNPIPPAAPAPSPPPPPRVASAPVTTLKLVPAPRPERRFGDAGVRLVGGAITASRSNSAFYGTETKFTVSPSFDYFLTPSFSAGVSALLGYDLLDGSGSFAGQHTWKFGLTGQLGVNAWLSERLSLWPKASLSFEQTRTTYNQVGGTVPVSNGMTGTTVTAIGPPPVGNIISVGISAPLLFHLAPHFFLGFGPTFTTDLHNQTGTGGTSNRATSFGASSLVGGWF